MTFEPSQYSAPPAYNDAAFATVAGLSIGLIVAAAVVPTFVVGPFVVKAFKPEWSYKRRLAATLAVEIGVGAVTQIVKAARGTSETSP
jgi:hypothetical protein